MKLFPWTIHTLKYSLRIFICEKNVKFKNSEVI